MNWRRSSEPNRASFVAGGWLALRSRLRGDVDAHAPDHLVDERNWVDLAELAELERALVVLHAAVLDHSLLETWNVPALLGAIALHIAERAE
eukprot:9480026-Pyramimonas_sp.AAC.1